MKNTTLYNLRRTDFQKAPLCDFRNIPYQVKKAFFSPWSGAAPGIEFGRLLKKSDSCICMALISCELMEALLGFLDVFEVFLSSVIGAFCVLLNSSEELRVRQRQLLVYAVLHVDQSELPDVF